MDSHEILAADLRVGHEVVTTTRVKGARKPRKTSRKIEEISECAGRWRTHLHVKVEGTSISWCYDGRDPVEVKGRAPTKQEILDRVALIAGAA